MKVIAGNGATHPLSRRPLSRVSRSFTGPILKGSKGSNAPVRSSCPERSLRCAFLPYCEINRDPFSWRTSVVAISHSRSGIYLLHKLLKS